MRLLSLIFSFFNLLPFQSSGQNPIMVCAGTQVSAITDSIYTLYDSTGLLSMSQVRDKFLLGHFKKLILKDEINKPLYDQWLYFRVQNASDDVHTPRISLAFIDQIDAFVQIDSVWEHYKAGDLLPLDAREVKTGQMCFISFSIPPHKIATCYIKIKSVTSISRQFREVSLKSIQLYSEEAFYQRFEVSRIYQALFYGAIFIMLFYNLFIYSTTLSFSYITYVVFLFALILFMSTNSGYVTELVLPDYPRQDLYLRFLSAPFLVICFLVFAVYYLEIRQLSPLLYKVSLGFLALLLCIVLVMLGSGWYLGRSMMIVASVVTFLFVLYAAFIISRKGFTPANYFLAANFLLILGATFYALERYNLVVNNLFMQYSVQLSVVFQSIFFSIGLADRIKLVSKQILVVEAEKNTLALQKEAERKRLIEEKNEALERSNQELDTFIYRTAHDIRGPLARLIGLTNLGLMDIQDSKALKYISMLKKDADFLNYLLNRLSTAHEIKNQEVFISSFQLHKLVLEVLTNLSFQEDYKKVVFEIEIDKSATVCSDLGLVRFILLNLLDNALKFRNENSASPSVVRVQAELSQNSFAIRVLDNGFGIKEDEVAYLFDMFSKAAGKYHNAGLGLYMTHLCAEKLGGKIHLKNNSQPTEFEVQLPNVVHSQMLELA